METKKLPNKTLKNKIIIIVVNNVVRLLETNHSYLLAISRSKATLTSETSVSNYQLTRHYIK
jgi:hypothetical protein